MKIIYLLLIFVFPFSKIWAQETVILNFKPIIENTDSLSIETFKMYISSIQFNYIDGSQYKEENSFHLLDTQQEKSLSLRFSDIKLKPIKSIYFNIGIDSTTNVSGAMGGDLDPTKGMYWAWQSGYINFKLEGKNKQCNSRNNEFTLHLGGYSFPYNSLQKVELNIESNLNTINIEIDLMRFLKSIKIKNNHHIMSPSKNAMMMANKIPEIFSIK